MTEYTAFRQLASRMIQQKGRPITLRRLSTVPADSGMPWKGGNDLVFADTLVTGVFTSFDVEIFNGTEVQREDAMVLIAADDIGGVSPKAGDRILDGAQTWAVINHRETRPGAESILYEVQLR